MLQRLAHALDRLLSASHDHPTGGAGALRPPDRPAPSAGQTDAGPNPKHSGGGKPPVPGGPVREGTGEDGPVEDIRYRDCAVAVNIKSDCEGEIIVNEKTKEAVRRLRDACDAYLGDESNSGSLEDALAAMGSTEEFGNSGGDSAGTNTPDSGGGLPPWVTVNVNVNKTDG
jgi:hypothetical protein